MISNKDFYNNFNSADSLFFKLKERVFLRTELNIVYSDLTNWERSGLLSIGGGSKKGDWKKLNYVEYIWLKIIEELRDYGFTYEEIELIKHNLFYKFTYEELVNAYKIDFENAKEELGQNAIDEFESIKEKKLDSNSFDVTVIDLIIADVITRAEQCSILFFKDELGTFIPISTDNFRGFDQIDCSDTIQEKLKETFLSISLSSIISNFLIDGDQAFEKRTVSVLTKEEHDLLKHVRKRYDNIKNIQIRFKNNQMKMLEVTTVKKAKLESRLLEHIKKGDYLSISIDTVEGKIVNFENTQKYKL